MTTDFKLSILFSKLNEWIIAMERLGFYKKIVCIIASLIFVLISHSAIAIEPGTNTPATVSGDITPDPVGNFIVPSYQQPGPLISLGQTIVDKGVSQIVLFGSYLNGNGQNYTAFAPEFIHGITDQLTFLFSSPYAVDFQQKGAHSSGFQDLDFQLEYAFYSKSTKTYTDTATVIGAVSLPTGSGTTNPPTGYGAVSYLIGGTFNRTYADWLGFVSGGVQLPTNHNGTKFGNSFLYQGAIGKNISVIQSKWVFAWLVEVDGTYSKRNQINNIVQHNSGGNTIYVTPSLTLSSKSMYWQLGIGVPVVQNLYGNQPKNNYSVSADITINI